MSRSQPLHDALDKFQSRYRYRHRHAHIDAASGGFPHRSSPRYRLGLPPAACEIDQCFRLAIRSAPLGCGWVIWRDEEALPQELVFNVDYPVVKLVLLLSTFRLAGQVIAQYHEFLRLGREGVPKYRTPLTSCRLSGG